MTRLRRWLRDFLEQALGRFYEGPRPPARLRWTAREFARLHPRATRDQWLEFASSHAEDAWRSAYVRGEEYAERDLEGGQPWRHGPTPEEVMDAVDPHWRGSPVVVLGPDHEVPASRPEGQAEREDMRAANEGAGGPLAAAMRDARPG